MTKILPDQKSEKYRLFGRRKGRPLRAHKQDLMNTLLPQLNIEMPEEGGSIDAQALFEFAPKKLILEVGFGGGEHLAGMAMRDPDQGFIGCEPFVNGVAKLLGAIDEENIKNIRVVPGDARVLLESLPDKSLDGAYVLYPDPWPKKRHIERRFLVHENLDRLARAIKPNGQLFMATDVEELGGWMRDQVLERKDFTLTYDSREAPKDWIPTRYEQKGIAAGRTPLYLAATRKS